MLANTKASSNLSFFPTLTEAHVPQFQALLYKVIDELHLGSKWINNIKDQYTTVILRQHTTSPQAHCPYFTDQEGNIVALAISIHDGGLGTVNWIAVDPLYRCQGLGFTLLESVLSFFEFSNCHRVDLKTYMNNISLRRFYSRTGFRVAALLPNHKFDVDIAYMLKDLK